MNSTTRSTPSAQQIQKEAAAPAIRHSGPTAERNQTALERYMRAIAVEQLPDAIGGPLATRKSTFPVRTVGDVMTKAVVTAYEGALFKEVAHALHRNRINAVPVIDGDRHVVGVVSASDLLARIAPRARPVPRGHRLTAHAEARRKHDALTARELMTSPAVTTSPNTRIADAAFAAARARVRSLPVVDGKGVLVGMVTRDDLIKQFLRDDADIRRDVIRYVLKSGDASETSRVTVTVDDGVVTLAGQVATALLARRLVFEAGLVVGVLDVEDELSFDVDDSSLLSSGGPIFGA
jgi:CBS domain-containing protein